MIVKKVRHVPTEWPYAVVLIGNVFSEVHDYPDEVSYDDACVQFQRLGWELAAVRDDDECGLAVYAKDVDKEEE